MAARPPGRIEFDFCPPTPVLVQRHPGQLTSDAGLLPVRPFDAAWRYTERMADCLTDARPDRRQSLASTLRQRVFGIAAGHDDCNDHDDLRHDPVFKFVADDRRPDGPALANQPTLSRFENDGRPAASRVAPGVERLRDHHGGQVPATVTLDPDATHGHQQLSPCHADCDQYQS